jgi:hypothetical protein
LADTRIASLEKELSNANELLEVSQRHERQLNSADDTEIVSSAAATVSRLLKSGMTLTQVKFGFELPGLVVSSFSLNSIS